MKKIAVFIICILVLCGCSKDYKEQEFYQDAYQILNIQSSCTTNQVVTDDLVYDYLEDLLNISRNHVKEYLSVDLKENQKVSKEDAITVLKEVKNLLMDKGYLETNFNEFYKQEFKSLDCVEDLKDASVGYYEVGGNYYYKDESIHELDLEDIYESFECESTFIPNLQESVIFPEGTTFDDNPDYLEPTSYHYQPLSSNYFHFNVAGIKVSGRLYQSGLEISLYSDSYLDMELNDSFKLSNFKVTTDIFYKGNDPHSFIKADYDIVNRLSLQKDIIKHTSTIPLDIQVLKSLENKLNNLNLEPAKATLDLLKFRFPVPNTLQKVTIEAALQLELSLSGEATLTFSSSNHQANVASHTYNGLVDKSTFSIEPYVDGDCSVSSMIDLSCYLGHLLIGDAYIGAGVGANASSQIYYVNQKEKEVINSTSKASLTQIEKELDLYQPSKEAYVDTCSNVEVYYFGKGGVGNHSDSLFYRLGITGQYVPISNSFKVYHFENHHEVSQCTRNYDLFSQELIKNNWQLNCYELHLQQGNTYQLLVENYDGVIEWSSSNNDVAIVNNGLVTILSEGNCIIEAKDENGNINQCVIIVDQGNKVEFNPLSC